MSRRSSRRIISKISWLIEFVTFYAVSNKLEMNYGNSIMYIYHIAISSNVRPTRLLLLIRIQRDFIR